MLFTAILRERTVEELHATRVPPQESREDSIFMRGLAPFPVAAAVSAAGQLAADDLLKSAKPGRFPQHAGRVRYPYRGQRLRKLSQACRPG